MAVRIASIGLSTLRIITLLVFVLFAILTLALNAHSLRKFKKYNPDDYPRDARPFVKKINRLHHALGFGMFTVVFTLLIFIPIVFWKRLTKFCPAFNFSFIRSSLAELISTTLVTLLWFVSAIAIVATRNDSVGSHTEGINRLRVLAADIAFFFLGFILLLVVISIDAWNFRSDRVGNHEKAAEVEAGGAHGPPEQPPTLPQDDAPFYTNHQQYPPGAPGNQLAATHPIVEMPKPDHHTPNP